MKALDDIMDLLLLVIVTGLMLPCLLRSANNIQDMDSWGFLQQEDKTAKILCGDTADMTLNEDAMTAAEVILFLTTSETTRIRHNKIILLDGTQITVNAEDYPDKVSEYTSAMSSVLIYNRKYKITYDYESEVWRITAI